MLIEHLNKCITKDHETSHIPVDNSMYSALRTNICLNNTQLIWEMYHSVLFYLDLALMTGFFWILDPRSSLATKISSIIIKLALTTVLLSQIVF